jgi:DNA-binding transcriptional MerR regulator
MDKSPDAYRTISEVADELGLPQHVLRFWETRFPQIKPLKRGGGRRFYRPEDIDLVRGIQTLLYSEGYTIKGVQRILKEEGVKPVQMVGRGSPAPKEPSAVDIPDDDVFTADEIDDGGMGDDVEPLRAMRDVTIRQDSQTRKEPVLSPVGQTEIGSVSDFVPSAEPRKVKSAAHVPQRAVLSEALRLAVNELEECARLIELAREKM